MPPGSLLWKGKWVVSGISLESRLSVASRRAEARTGMTQDGGWRTTMTTQTEWKWLGRWVTGGGVLV